MKRRTLVVGAALATTGGAFGMLYRRTPTGTSKSELALTNRSGPFLLPPGFTCTVLIERGKQHTDGTRSADAPDGMACFSDARGNWILLRNHELDDDAREGAFPEAPSPLAYDAEYHGGVSRLVVDPATLRVISSNTVLSGTHRNCAGGPSPWGWLTCEESEEPRHGYVFACAADAERATKPLKIPGYGRFRHEAVAVDPETLRAYLTEDQADGALYRFTPNAAADPFVGRLEALRVRGKKDFDVSDSLRPGRRVEVEWVGIDDPEAERRTTREQAHEKGAAAIRRGEGAWFDARSVVVTSTSGGPRGLGQVLRLHLREGKEGSSGHDELEVVCESQNAEDWKSPDNITVAPNGDLVFAEDGGSDQHLRGVTPDGLVYSIARNVGSESELAGVCFSPDGSTLFCNLQRDGTTVAIRGPWEQIART